MYIVQCTYVHIEQSTLYNVKYITAEHIPRSEAELYDLQLEIILFCGCIGGENNKHLVQAQPPELVWSRNTLLSINLIFGDDSLELCLGTLQK